MHAAWREFYGFLGIGGPKVENREFVNLPIWRETIINMAAMMEGLAAMGTIRITSSKKPRISSISQKCHACGK